jgi:diketogulonate reductase-like aldo/keto reductase
MGLAVIPRSGSLKHLQENAAVADFELPDRAMQLLNGLGWLFEWCPPQLQRDVLGLAPLARLMLDR